ncbi:MAG: polyphenol oxidase family protein [Elusimicrobia bacterium]|nr:polyphenol oxidase family protein [Elusimicrobiota bacterium]
MPRSSSLEIPGATGWIEKDGFLVHSALTALGLAHAFTTRRQGSMKEAARRGAAAALLGLPEPLVLKQVHGTEVHPAAHSAQGLEGDGWTLGPGDEDLCVAVFAADCMPLFLWSDDGRHAGVFHAGWKGMAAGMPGRAVGALVARGATAARLNAAFGPHIGVDAYRVGPELEARFPASSFSRRPDGPHLDLGADARRQLTEAGLRPEAIGPSAPCTLSNDGFFSFRRDKQDARMMALLSLSRRPA